MTPSEPRTIDVSNFAIPAYVRAVCDRLAAEGERALIAGGAVRDHLLERPVHDFDIAASAAPEVVDRLFDRVVLVGARFGVSRVICPEGEVEVARFRADLEYEDGRHPVGVRFVSEREDARRRDFTVNGLFYDPVAGTVIDYVGGLADLEAKTLRAIGDPCERFREDRLRLLRAIRFATVLGFPIESETWAAIVAESSHIMEVSGERIRDELLKILLPAERRRGYQLLTDSGLMKEILPEVEAMRGVEQPPEYHPEGDVHLHTGMVLEQLDNPSHALALGALLHDIGKPSTFTVTDRIRFNNHDNVGAGMTEEICQRLRLSRKETEAVVFLVRRHMVLPSVAGMRPTRRRRLFEEEHFDTLLKLGYADCRGSHGNLSACDSARQLYEAHLLEDPPLEPLLQGRDLLALGLAPGPRIGDLLRRLEEQRDEGVIENTEAALEWVRQTIAAEGEART